MKIYYLSNSPIPSSKANSIQVMKMCQSIAASGHDVVLFAQETKETVDDVYDYYGVERTFQIEWQSWPKIKGIGGHFFARRVNKKLISREMPDAVYGRDLYSLLKVSKLGIPFIYEAHIVPTNIYMKYLIGKLLKMRNLKKLVVISDSLKKAYSQLFPWIDAENICVIRSGAEDPNISSENLKEGVHNLTRIGYVGHLYPGKGMELIIQLAELLPEYEFHIVGGTQTDIDYWKTVSKAQNIIYHGFVSNKLLFKYYDEFDILIAPYQKQTVKNKVFGEVDKWASPMKIIEYMSYKKPLIASDLPMIREIITNGENGLLCDLQNAEDWANSIKMLAHNDELREKISKNAYEDFAASFTWQNRARIAVDQFSK